MMQRADLESVFSKPLATSAAAPDLPTRVLKLSLDFTLDRLRAGRKVFADDLLAALVFGAVTDGNVEHVDDDEALSRLLTPLDDPMPDQERRLISGYSIALRLGAPRETVRRKIHRLSAQGWLKAGEGGYYAPAEMLAGQAVSDYVAGAYAACVAYFQGMADLGMVSADLVATARQGPPLPRKVARAFTRFVPHALEPMQRLCGGEQTTGVVFAALVAHSLEDRPTQPLSALRLADRLGMARETTRRHLGHLHGLKLIGDCSHGPSVPAEVLGSSRVKLAFDRMWQHRPALLARMAVAGVLAQRPG